MTNAAAPTPQDVTNNAPPASQGNARRRRRRSTPVLRGRLDGGADLGGCGGAGDCGGTPPGADGLSARTALGGVGTDTETHTSREAIGRDSMALARRQGSYQRACSPQTAGGRTAERAARRQ